MRHPISVQPQSTYQSSNSQLRIFITIRRHIGAYHGPDLVFHTVTVTCNITCVSFEVMCLCRVVVLWGFLGRARDKRNNYRRLKKITIKNRYPLPLAADIINRLTKARYFTKFDVRWGYHNIRIKEGDEWKGAIVTNRGLYEPKVMYFGVTDAPFCVYFEVVIIRYDKVARDRETVHMINTRAETSPDRT